MVGVILRLWSGLLLCATLAGCGAISREIAEGGGDLVGFPVGKNMVGEACTAERASAATGALGSSDAYLVHCGTWQQPSARLFVVNRAGGPDALMDRIAAGAFHAYLDQRMTCKPARVQALLVMSDAAVAECALKRGGWPTIAFTVSAGDHTFLAEGIPAAQPALEAAIARLSGTAQPVEADASNRVAALIAQSSGALFGAGDMQAYYDRFTLGEYYDAAGRFDQAEAAYREALAINQRLLGANNAANADAMMHLALELSNQGRYLDAEAMFTRCDQWMAGDPPSIQKARLLSYRGFHAANQGLTNRALSLSRQANEMRQGLLSATAGPQGSMALAFGPETDSPQALQIGDSDAALRAEVAQGRFAEAALVSRGGDIDGAWQIIDATLRGLQQEGQAPEWWPPRYLDLAAQIAERQGKLGEAEVLRRQAGAQWDALLRGSRRQGISALALARVVAARGNTAEALTIGRQAIAAIRSSGEGVSLDEVQAHLEMLDKTAQQAPNDAASIHDEMLEVASLVREGVTARSIALASARVASGDKDVAALIRDKQDKDLKRFQAERDFNQLASIDPDARDPEEVERLRLQIQELTAETASLEEAIQSASPEYSQLVDKPVAAADVRARLGVDEGIVLIVLSERSLGWGFVVTRDEVRPYRMGGSYEEISTLVRDLLDSVQIGSDGGVPVFDVQAAYRLYAMVLEPGAQALGSRERMIVIPSKQLLALPLGVLVVRDTAPVANEDYRQVPFLAKERVISVVPSLRSFVSLRQSAGRSPAAQPMIGFGDFKGGAVVAGDPTSATTRSAARHGETCLEDATLLSGIAPLPSTRTELKSVASVLGEDSSRVVLGDSFTKQTVNSAELDQYRVVYFATHGLLADDLSCWRQPALVLSTPNTSTATVDDILLQADQVLDLKLNADVVVLSACNTAAGDGDSAGESLSGLARSFLYSGSRAVIASHWPVPDEATGILMPEVFRFHNSNAEQGYDYALAHAERAILSRAGGDVPLSWSHPLFWAPFSFIGNASINPASASG